MLMVSALSIMVTMHSCIGIPLLYMILVVPLGFLVNTEHINGSHYGGRDANGRLLWYMIYSDDD